MSDSEKMGRCFNEVYECRGSPSELKIADAIDRLAADVASIKASVERIEAVATTTAVTLTPPSAALLMAFDHPPGDSKPLRSALRDKEAEVERLKESRDAANRLYGATLAEVERLKAIVHSDAGHMAKILIENERLRAGPAAPQPAAPPAGWLTEEERELLQSRLHALRVYLRRWQADRGSVAREVKIIDALLSRAGSPPVVEVPELGFLGPMTGREQGIVLAYRDALDAAGVSWKEVSRGQDLK